MEKLKAIGCPPLRGAATGGQGGQRRRLEGIALLAAAVVLPALAGCPGRLDFSAWPTDGPGPVTTPHVDAGPPGRRPDAAIQPPAVPETTPTPGIAPETCAKADEILTKILIPVCAGCHGGAMPRAGLDLSTMGAKGRLLAASAKGLMAMTCSGKPLLSAADGTGVFLDKISGSNCGPQMPMGKPPLNDLAIACLKVWLQPAPMAPGPPPAPPPPAVDKTICATAPEVSKLLATKCGTCHGGMAPRAMLDLATMGAKARLLNIPAKSPMSPQCMGKPLAVAADGTGVFFNKILGMGCGNQMPFNGTPLSNQELWCLQEWIKTGAGGTFPAMPATLPLVPPVGGPPPPPPRDGGAPDVAVAANCATPDEISNKILKPKCLPCHGKVMPALGLDLESPGAKARILGVTSKEGGVCGGKPLADGTDQGVLLQKVTGPVPMGCGNQMPFGTAPLSSVEVDCLKAWLK
jgi:hypothetical protein